MPTCHSASDPKQNTVATLISLALLEAETLFGERDRTWTFVGYEFHGSVPRTIRDIDRRHVRMRLTSEAHDYLNTAACEIAHEVIHLLSPVDWANNLEEGIAVWFGQSFYARHWRCYWRQSLGHYTDARRAFLKVWQTHPNFVRDLRNLNTSISAVTPEMLTQVAPSINEELARFLCEALPDPENQRRIGPVAKGNLNKKRQLRCRLHQVGKILGCDVGLHGVNLLSENKHASSVAETTSNSPGPS
jgi:hypothetical protein